MRPHSPDNPVVFLIHAIISNRRNLLPYATNAVIFYLCYSFGGGVYRSVFAMIRLTTSFGFSRRVSPTGCRLNLSGVAAKGHPLIAADHPLYRSMFAKLLAMRLGEIRVPGYSTISSAFDWQATGQTDCAQYADRPPRKRLLCHPHAFQSSS